MCLYVCERDREVDREKERDRKKTKITQFFPSQPCRVLSRSLSEEISFSDWPENYFNETKVGSQILMMWFSVTFELRLRSGLVPGDLAARAHTLMTSHPVTSQVIENMQDLFADHIIFPDAEMCLSISSCQEV